MNTASPETSQAEQNEMFTSYSIEIADEGLAIDFLKIVDSQIHATEIQLELRAGGLDRPETYEDSIEGQRRYVEECEAAGVISYSALTIDQRSGSIPKFEVNSMGVDARGYFPGRNISVSRGISNKGGFQTLFYFPPRNGTIDYGANLREFDEGGYAITDAQLTFRSDPKDLSPASYAGSLSMNKDQGIYRFSLDITEKMDEQRASDLRTLLEAAELAKLDDNFSIGKHLYEKQEAEIEALGARPISNIKEAEYFRQIILAAMLFSKPDIGLEVHEGQYKFGAPGKIADTGYSVWAELEGYAQSRRVYKELERNNLISAIGSASYMAYVGPEIIFRDFDEHLIEAGVDDDEERARFKANVAQWAIMQIDQNFEEANWDEHGYAVPTEHMSKSAATKRAYQEFLEEIGAEPFSDQEIAQRIGAIIDEESSRLS